MTNDDETNQQRKAEVKSEARPDNATDQSLDTHILNGLFPANLIYRFNYV